MALAKLREGLHVSASQLRTFLICPRRHALQYQRGVPPAFVPQAVAFGSAFHAALGCYFGLIKETGAAPVLDELASVFRDAWANAADGPVPIQADDEEGVADPTDKAVAMLSAFLAHAAELPLPEVIEVERAFALDVIDPSTGEQLEERLVGAMDLVVREHGRLVVTEIKTAARKWSSDQLRFDSQITAYQLGAAALGWGEVGLRYLVITKGTKKPAVQVADVMRDAQDVDDFLHTIVGVLRAIDAGVSYPLRETWKCRTCPHAHACSGSTR